MYKGQPCLLNAAWVMLVLCSLLIRITNHMTYFKGSWSVQSIWKLIVAECYPVLFCHLVADVHSVPWRAGQVAVPSTFTVILWQRQVVVVMSERDDTELRHFQDWILFKILFLSRTTDLNTPICENIFTCAVNACSCRTTKKFFFFYVYFSGFWIS